jgi:1-acyl-sn-glycerol-3-phosphate acyltransferase
LVGDLVRRSSTVSDRCAQVSTRIARAFFAPFAQLHFWPAPGARESTGAAILVSNHISHFDPFFISLGAGFQIDWMTSEEFYSNAIVGAWLRAVQTFPVDRTKPDRKALRVALERLRAGRVVGMFPDGGIRAGAGSILEEAVPKGGATTLARMSGAPILPCVIFGTDRLYAPIAWSPRTPRVPVWVAMGAPLFVEKSRNADADAQLARALRNLATAAIAHFKLSTNDLPMTPQQRRGGAAPTRTG